MPRNGYEEQTFSMLKPDAFYRGLVGDVIGRFEDRGLKVSASYTTWPDEETVRDHYGETDLDGEMKENLVEYITAGPVMPIIVEGRNAQDVVRKTVGEHLDPTACDPGTIRNDYSAFSTYDCDDENMALPNLVHAADSPETAEREIDIWFGDDAVDELSMRGSYDRPDVEYVRRVVMQADEDVLEELLDDFDEDVLNTYLDDRQ